MKQNLPVLLLVEDNSTLRGALCRYLHRRLPVQLVEAASGSEAVLLAQCLNPEIVLVDLSLPDQMGVGVIPLLKAVRPAATVIAMASHPEEEHARAAALLGAKICLPKEALVSKLEPVIWRALAEGSLGWSARLTLWRHYLRTRVTMPLRRSFASASDSVQCGIRWADREIWPGKTRLRLLYTANLVGWLLIGAFQFRVM